MDKESDLIEKLKQGNEAAYQEVCAKYQDHIFNLILPIVQSVTDAEDLTQETFVDVFMHIDRFNQKAKLATWLYRIAANKALNHRRYWKAKKRFSVVLSIFSLLPQEESPDLAHPLAVLEEKEKTALLYKAIDALPAKQREAFVLRQTEDRSYAEIAEIMQASIASVESLLFRAKQNLQNYLQGRV